MKVFDILHMVWDFGVYRCVLYGLKCIGSFFFPITNEHLGIERTA